MERLSFTNEIVRERESEILSYSFLENKEICQIHMIVIVMIK